MTKNFKQLSFYTFFTKYSLMEDYGFGSGLIHRVFRKILPKVPLENSIEFYLLKSGLTMDEIIGQLDLENMKESAISSQLDMSIKALGTKVVAFGLDNNIKGKFVLLHQDISIFEKLLEELNAVSQSESKQNEHLSQTLTEVEKRIVFLRKNKKKIGTSFHLTVTTRKILEYIYHLQDLILLKGNLNSSAHWKEIFLKYISYSKQQNSLRRFIIRHSDLVALEIVERTSTKGEKYIAESKREYWGFFYKSLLGGAIISIFALLKIMVDSIDLSPLQNAFIFSLNYAVCFIIVKQFGGIIATKQPAVTASRIAKGIYGEHAEEVDSLDVVTDLIKKVSRSQFISIIGNFIMAVLFACLLSFIFKICTFYQVINTINPDYLLKKTIPSGELILFASVAGVFLAMAGLISGFIDNKVIASTFAHRIRHSNLFFKSNVFANFIEKKSGAFIGNIVLGFFLGSVFLLSSILPFSIDIRHIAFSSANVGYSIINGEVNYQVILLALSGALLIGLVNFLVSFSITLYLALKSRGVSFRFLPKLLIALFKDFIRSPISFFMFRGN